MQIQSLTVVQVHVKGFGVICVLEKALVLSLESTGGIRSTGSNGGQAEFQKNCIGSRAGPKA